MEEREKRRVPLNMKVLSESFKSALPTKGLRIMRRY
jgi:hypothetical protein